MGPIHDLWGLEQGGKNSSDFFKVYNNEQLNIAQESGLGVDLGGTQPLVVSAVGQADDVCLVSNNIHSLKSLMELSLAYCRRHFITLNADKTKLQAFSNTSTFLQAYYDSLISQVEVNNESIDFAEENEHV